MNSSPNVSLLSSSKERQRNRDSTFIADDDEWIFSLRVPSSVQVIDENVPVKDRRGLSDGTTGQRSQGAAAACKTIELRQRQHTRPLSKDYDEATDEIGPQTIDLESAETSSDPEAERQSLLEKDDFSPSWTFESTYWSFHSSTLMTVTYCHAWQAIPEFTNITGNCGGRFLAKVSCCCDNARKAEYLSETFTVKDITKIEKISKYSIKGIGDCTAIRIYLRPFHFNAETKGSMPHYYEDAWQRHLENFHNNRQKRNLQTSAEDNNLQVRELDGPMLIFCLSSNKTDPPLLWKAYIPVFKLPIALHTVTVLDGYINSQSPLPAKQKGHHIPEPTHIYLNGYQSWSFTGSILRGKQQPKSALPKVFSRAFNYGGSPPPHSTAILSSPEIYGNRSSKSRIEAAFKKHYQSDFFTCITSDGRLGPEQKFPYQQLDETGGPALILGWLSQHQQFGVITANKDLSRCRMHSSAHGQMLIPGGVTDPVFSTDWAYAQLILPHSYDEEPMAEFLHAIAEFNHARPLQNGNLLTGWCSWYVFYEKITAGILRENFGKLAAMRSNVLTNVSVVDDGYMTAWGDWESLKPGAFPSSGGMGVVARDIRSHLMRPGIWLAPFAADKHSKIVKKHPDWIIRNDNGVPANSSNCGKFFYGLDATNPAVRAHVYESVHRAVHDWGFTVLKIDFLYAACLEGNGKYDLTMTRAEAMLLALQTIRDAAGPDVFLIGCGCPIASGIGYVDAMRVSADTGPTWKAELPLPWWDEGTLPALRSMIRNSISRAPFGHRFWHNDPDCLMLGEHTKLTDAEVASAATVVAMTCGMLLLSDDLPKVGKSRMNIISKIFPLTGVTAVVLDLHSTNDGLPSLLRLWCTDFYDVHDSFHESSKEQDLGDNAEATFYARRISFSPGEDRADPSDRMRSCIHVTKGMGTWTVVSISNWSDKPSVVHVPPPAMLPPPALGWNSVDAFEDDLNSKNITTGSGYHIFAFWSAKYSWLSSENNEKNRAKSAPTLCKKLGAHETEVFHIKKVTPDFPQYIGSTLHFSCGQEVQRLKKSSNSITILLKNSFSRDGYIFVFVPRTNLNDVVLTVNNKPGRWSAAGNTPKVGDNGSLRLAGRVLRIAVKIFGDNRPNDGEIKLSF